MSKSLEIKEYKKKIEKLAEELYISGKLSEDKQQEINDLLFDIEFIIDEEVN